MKIAVLDIETCATAITAIVPAIGITVIDTKNPRPVLLEHANSENSLFVRLNAYEQQDVHCRTEDKETMTFWRKQSDEAREFVFSESNTNSVEQAMRKLVDFMNEHKPQRIYTRGPHFDYVILCSLFSEYPEFEKAFSHWNIRDCRTIVEFQTNSSKVKTEHDGFIYHHPTHDAVRDAIAIWDAWDWKKKINAQTKANESELV